MRRLALIAAFPIILFGVPAAAQISMPSMSASGSRRHSAFTSDRISVEVVGSGPDVVLIPGLSSSPDVWRSTIAAMPGYRYHLIHVRGLQDWRPARMAPGRLSRQWLMKLRAMCVTVD